MRRVHGSRPRSLGMGCGASLCGRPMKVARSIGRRARPTRASHHLQAGRACGCTIPRSPIREQRPRSRTSLSGYRRVQGRGSLRCFPHASPPRPSGSRPARNPYFTGIFCTTQPRRPLTPEYQAVFEANLADRAAGGQEYNPAINCLPAGMPRVMVAYDPLEIIVTPQLTYIRSDHLPRAEQQSR